jgi:ABC-2 type transport system permease protein
MLLAGFRRQAAYRLAAVTGLVTNAFFGAVRTAVFLALYRQRGQVAGMDLSDALTYVWVLEALFGVIWVAWFWETAESIRSGTSWSSCCARVTCTCGCSPSTSAAA